jgi:hypothetical protein
MRETQAAARAQLIRASTLEDLSDATYRQKVPYCVRPHCQSATVVRGQLFVSFLALCEVEGNLCPRIVDAE